MCGISGIIHFATGEPIDPGLIARMNAIQRHRGPDEEGTHVTPLAALGNRRLAIVDRAHGRQPLSSADGSLWITYNGEIYNHDELRHTLAQLGRNFRTRSDTEVVLHAYAQWGASCVDRFNGQFAFAIWNERDRTLFLARDRLGIAPLHYAIDDGRIVFASEAKAIFEHPGYAPAIDSEAVAESLLCGTLFEGRTLFTGIRALPPGHHLTVTASGARLDEYWDIPLHPVISAADAEHAYEEQILPLLEHALSIRRSDEVPWGLMLSGGTDSSTLATMAMRAGDGPVQTFTIDFPNAWKRRGDAHYARLMADVLGTHHREFMTRAEDYYTTLEQVIWHVERPFNKGASTMYLLYKQLSEHATVVITGEGADELFAGYVGERGLGLDEVVRSGGIDGFPWAAYWHTTAQLFSRDFTHTTRPGELFAQRFADAQPRHANGDALNAALYLYTKHFLLELLELHDRTSLAFGVEARLPFLDHRLVELLSPMPSHLKYRDGQTKFVFKRALRGILPPEILERKKTPMPIPRDPATLLAHVQMTRDLLCAHDARSRDYYDMPRVLNFLERKGEFADIDSLCVWKVSTYLLTLELLHRVFRG